jgi:FkbM family methyltransferase
MNIPKSYHQLIASLQFYLEKFGIAPYSYPRIIQQTKILPGSIAYEVDNLTEANRVLFYDDELDFIKYLVSEIKPDDTFYDIGACIGMYTMHLAFKGNLIYAFEPEPNFRDHLVKNIALNKISNIQIMPYAVSNVDGKTSLYTSGASGKSPSLSDNGYTQSVDVLTRSLDSLVINDGLQSPNIVKLDIEGAEILALRGMKSVLKDHPPRLILIEIHPELLRNFNSSTEEIYSIFAENGYEIVLQVQRDRQIHIVFSKKIL